MTAAQIKQNWAIQLPTTILLAVVGLGVAPPITTLAQTTPSQVTPDTTQNNPELAEAERLNQQVIELYKQGKYAEATPIAERALAIYEKALGAEHPYVVSSLNNLALLYKEQGKYAQAEPLFLRALAIREKVLGAEHSAVATSLNNLAALYEDQGKYTQAEPLFLRALAIREKVLGAEHPDVVASLNNLASLYHDQGKYDQAEPLYQRALTIFEKVLGAEHPDVATSLNNLATLYRDQGKYDQAESLFQRALAIREKVLGAEHPDVATSLNNLAALYKDQGKYTQAEPLYQRALAIYEQVLGAEHRLVATSLNNLALLYRDQGKYAQAESLFQRALAIREKVLGAEHPSVAASVNNLAALYKDQGKYAQAEPLYQRALAIYEQVLGAEHPLVAVSLGNLAELYRAQGKYAQAEPLYQRALAIREKVLGAEHPSVATSLNNLAELYKNQGKYVQAEPLYQRALAIVQKSLGAEHPDVATSLNNLALLYQEQGKYAQVEPLFLRALAIREKVLGAEHPSVAASLNSLAILYKYQRKYTQAEPLYQRALAIDEQALGSEHPDVATNLNNLALLYSEQEKYAQAEPLYQRSLAILEKVLGAEHPNVANSLNNLAGLYREQGKYTQAEPLFQQSLAILEKVLGTEHPNVANSLNNLAGLYQAQGDINRAVEFQIRGVNIEEQNLALNLAVGSETDKRAYTATLSNTTDAVISLHLQTAPNHPQAARLALTTILQRKGRVLDALSDSLQTLRRHLTPADQTLLDELAANRSQQSALIFHKPEKLSLQEYKQTIANLKTQAEKQEAQLARRSAQFRTVAQPVTIDAVQKLIPADAALVELVFYQPRDPKATPGKRWGNPRYAAYILRSQGEPEWLDLGEAKTIDKAVKEFRTTVVDTRQKSTGLKTARALDALLMQPVRQKLGNARQILLSPDSQLNLIPFAALVDENNRYLVENYTITYLTTGRDLLRLANHNPSKQPPVVIANPDFEKSNSDSIQIASRGAGERSTDLNNVQFSALPGTAAEAQELAPLLPNATILTGWQATENAVKQVNSPRILHIATHGFFLQDVPLIAPPSRGGIEVVSINNSSSETKIPSPGSLENPLLRSGLVLAGFNIRQSGNEDGVLTALEAAGLDLIGTKLLVLSACQTGLGDVANGEGVYGLRRAFAIAGVESQLMSLWYVSDAGTKELMVKYYQRLLKGEGRSEALRQTQLEMLHNPKYSHPYLWAAFIPSGDWSPMQ